ncbi:hypothetical protein ACE6H2_000794 [Prunus campanulata]
MPRVLALSSLRSQHLLRFSDHLWFLVPRWHRLLVSSDLTLVVGSVWWYLSLCAPFFAVSLVLSPVCGCEVVWLLLASVGSDA